MDAGQRVLQLRVARRWDDALEACREVENPYPLACELLRAGRWSEGWPLYERRFHPGGLLKPPLPFPEWRGEAVESLLVWPEQGFGDVIMFARFIRPLVENGVRVTLVCRPTLVRLFSRLGCAVVPLGPQIRLEPHDAWTMLGSLPLHLGVTLETLPSASYITAAPSGLGRAAVVWKGDPKHPNDRNRSMLGNPFDLPSLHPEDTGAADFQDTASIIAGLDLVVSVDTSIAHLAGAMGKPCWLMLPYVGADWRWLRDREDSPWYPSMKLFHQTAPGDWSGVVERVRRALAP